MTTSSIPMDEMRLTRYIDLAVREFNRSVGIYPGLIIIPEMHGYYGMLWRLGQQSRFFVAYRERSYEWLDLYLSYNVEDKEIWIFLFYHPIYMWGFKYVIENENVCRVTELKDGFRMPRWTVRGTLEKVKVHAG